MDAIISLTEPNRNGTELGFGGGVAILTKANQLIDGGIEIFHVITKIGDPMSPKVDGKFISEMIKDVPGLFDIDLYIAHATGTVQGDEAEWWAINNSGPYHKKVPVWASKGYTKHLLYASGIPSLCAAEVFLKNNVVPKIHNLKEFAFEQNDAYPVIDNTSVDLSNVLIGMFGFSGCNAIVNLILR